MLSKLILPLLAPCIAFVVAQDTITSQGSHEAELEANSYIVTHTTSWEDYLNKPTGLLTNPNAYAIKPTPTTLETVTRPPDIDAKPTATAMAMQKSAPAPNYHEGVEPGLEYATMGQHILFYGAHSEEDIDALGLVIAQAKGLYDVGDLRCYAPYRTSKYLPGSDITGYLESRILACENGYSLRLGTHNMGTAKAERCKYVGVTFSEQFQAGIKNGAAKAITPHIVEDDKYRLIASSYLRKSTWDLRFGFEKKGCPPKDGTDEGKAEYVKVLSLDEWSKYAEENPAFFKFDWPDLLPQTTNPPPPKHVPTLGELPPSGATSAPDPVTTEAQVTGQTSAVMRRDESPPQLEESDNFVAPMESVAKKQAASLLLEAIGVISKAQAPTPTTVAIETPAELPEEPGPTPFDPVDPTFSDPPVHTLSYIQPA
ncbi:uncharacterized protein DFL_009751 [Arthrobotrys flagrans]|uniref:Uncharacterized protein n=1 Tax=Arthrobotrys flagrans TaxID=97331 RepID=A0A436ZSJ3_ARTFL|nr:hypothetical protein DFL_009751 [Arthrobotrys flagrans]